MKAIVANVKLKASQFAGLLGLILLSAVGQMLLPSFLARMISDGVGRFDAR